jgi:hypothetical protein
MKSLSNFCAKKRLWQKVRSKGRTTLNVAICNNRKLTKTKRKLSRTKKSKELVQLVKEGAYVHKSCFINTSVQWVCGEMKITSSATRVHGKGYPSSSWALPR